MPTATNVIELLSSSPSHEAALPSPKLSHPSITVSFKSPITTTAISKSANEFHFLSDDFDSSIRLDEENWEQSAAKRRKVSSRSEYNVRIERNVSTRAKLPKGKNQGWAVIDGDVDGDAVGLLEARWEVEDDIVFTSPLGHGQGMQKKNNKRGSAALSSDDDLPEDVLSTLNAVRKEPSNISDRTAKLLQTLDGGAQEGKAPAKGKGASRKPLIRQLSKASGELSNIGSQSSDSEGYTPAQSKPAAPPKQRKKLSPVTEESLTRDLDKMHEREARAAQKAKEKEQAQELKRIERAQKAKDKEVAAAFAEVNKSKKDKKESTKEMIVDLPSSLLQNQAQDAQIRKMVKNIGLEPTTYESPIPNIIKWRRKVESRYNAEKGYRVAMPMEIKDEKHVMVLLSAGELVGLVMAETGCEDTLDAHVQKLKGAFPNRIPIYMIEGLRVWMGKNKNARNKAFREGVIAQEAQSTTIDATTQAPHSKPRGSKTKASPPSYIDETALEDALLKLQVLHGCLIHHTMTCLDTAQWITNFTQHISTIPYKHERFALSTTFCMESGQVKTGEDKHDTFVKMLQEVVRVTPPIAYGIAGEYPSVLALVKGFEEKGPLCLKDIRKCANRDGALTDGCVGQAVSRRLHSIFTSLDPGSVDV